MKVISKPDAVVPNTEMDAVQVATVLGLSRIGVAGKTRQGLERAESRRDAMAVVPLPAWLNNAGVAGRVFPVERGLAVRLPNGATATAGPDDWLIHYRGDIRVTRDAIFRRGFDIVGAPKA